MIRKAERKIETGEIPAVGQLFFGASAPLIARESQNQSTGGLSSNQPASHPSDRPTRRRRGSPRDASRLRAAARLRCEPLRLASSADVRPRVLSSSSTRATLCRSAVARARAIGGARDLSLPQPLPLPPPPPPPSPPPLHRKKRWCARERFSSGSSSFSDYRATVRTRSYRGSARDLSGEKIGSVISVLRLAGCLCLVPPRRFATFRFAKVSGEIMAPDSCDRVPVSRRSSREETRPRGTSEWLLLIHVSRKFIRGS